MSGGSGRGLDGEGHHQGNCQRDFGRFEFILSNFQKYLASMMNQMAAQPSHIHTTTVAGVVWKSRAKSAITFRKIISKGFGLKESVSFLTQNQENLF